MKNQKLFDRTVGILVKSYFNNTLEYTDCAACAVGNIVAANNGVDLIRVGEYWASKGSDYNTGDWFTCMRAGQGRAGIMKELLNPEIIKQAETTGYSIEELSDIELAFSKGSRQDGTFDNFEGLMEVINYLTILHEATTEENTQAKTLFKKELAEVG